MAKKPKTEEELQLNRLKMEVAEELGLTERVRTGGWGNISAEESGRIGGIVSQRRRLQGRGATDHSQIFQAKEQSHEDS